MPFWPSPPVLSPTSVGSLPETPVERELQARHTMRFGQNLTVEFEHVSYREGAYVFTGDVVAKYLETTLRTAELKVFSLEHRMETTSVRIDDPDVQISADQLAVDYAAKTGRATNMVLKAEGVTVSAGVGTVEGSKITLHDASGTSSRRSRPMYRVRAREVEIEPGKGGVARSIVPELFGVAFPTVPRYSFNLDPRVTGLRVPDVAFKPGAGLGIGWSSAILLDQRTAAFGGFGTFPGEAPSYSLSIGRSTLDPKLTGSGVLPRSDLGEFAVDGWFTTLLTRDPSEQPASIRAKRQSYSIGTTWNSGTAGRLDDISDITKLVEIATEQGGAMGPLGFNLTARGQRIRSSAEDPWVDRLVFDGTLGSVAVPVAPKVSLLTRLDFRGTTSRANTFGFARFEAGLAWTPYQGFDLGVAGSTGSQVGTPDFAFDAMPYMRNAVVRADYRRGFLTLRGMWRYDWTTGNWFDRQYEVAVVADGIEPYVWSRSFPNDYRIGIRFRFDQFANRLMQRELTRKGQGSVTR